MPAPPQIPDMDLMAVFTIEQQFGDQPVLDHIRRAPLAGDHRVMAEMPPEVVCQVLRAVIRFPWALNIEARVVHGKHAARSIAVRGAERADIDGIGTTMNRVRAAVSALL